MSEKYDKGGIQVISRAASILRVLKETQSGMSLGNIAARVSLPRSTVQRITSALAEEGYVITDAHGGGLRLGPELSALAGAAQYNIVEHCRLLLNELTQKTGETTDLAVMRGIGMVFLDQVPGSHRLTTVSKVGEVFPLTTTANGKACLAQLPEDEAAKLITNEWTRNGVTSDVDALLRQLAEIRRTGLAYDLDEHSSGVSAIGFAFTNWGGELHAISVPVPSSRFSGQRRMIEKALLETAVNIQRIFK
ncbi:Transcriptional regulator, IclR family [Candidatus Rhodobacter oscarellae]|uniref:Transcriptional regulator, IclR family n=1 Tax=Candidatus Rhodobacter oscarellae TaxID=1675527 RepID=A0A0J9ECB5_9RHOB|nr:IclR family transcriptional regulator [Candidatus Rhodobacter lobularis]KMW60400.1 Transcriptional regulator, IclR family [Candidatus Rhodobacter lobularis]